MSNLVYGVVGWRWGGLDWCGEPPIGMVEVTTFSLNIGCHFYHGSYRVLGGPGTQAEPAFRFPRSSHCSLFLVCGI